MKFLILAVLGLISAIVLGIYRNREDNKRSDRWSNSALIEAFGELVGGIPILKIGTSYGYPTYSVTFKNKEHMEEAQSKGRDEVFKQAVQHVNRADPSFDSDNAVFFSYEGQTYTFTEVDSTGKPINPSPD